MNLSLNRESQTGETMELQHNKPLVSIGMPAYNGEQYIRKALDSLLAQDYENFELIISDNASMDATFQICQEYAERDKHIRVYRNDNNLGFLRNFEIVLEKARGNYFMWAAVDDYWLPEFVSTLVKELETHSDAGVVMCAVDLIMEGGKPVKTIQYKGKDDPNRMGYYQMLMGLTGTGKYKRKYNLYIYGLFRTDLLRQAMRFFIDTLFADRIFLCQIALITRFRYVDRVLHIRTIHYQNTYVRNPDEKFSQVFNQKMWLRFRVVLDLGKMLWKSDMIPIHRKLYISQAMWRMAHLTFNTIVAQRKSLKSQVNAKR